MRLPLRTGLVLLLTLSMVTVIFAVTVVSVNKTCPICGEVNEFETFASWGSYIYQWPSKYQFVFFPQTNSATHYICKRCHFAAYMWDWEKVPKEKIDAIRAALKESPSPAKFKDYSEVAVSTRMEIAERVYKVLNKDDAFWEDFYRVMGFHYAAEHKTAQATAARRKALALTEARMNRPENAGERKKELMIAAAMHHFLGEDDVALRQLQELSTLTYSAGGDKENAKGLDEYLNKLAKDYQEQIKAGKVPDGFSSE